MIRRSFIFLDRFSHRKEQNLWKSGITSWDAFLTTETVCGIASHKKPYFDRQILTAQKHLYLGDAAYFALLLPSSEHWRLFDFFKEDCVFLDIETTGPPRRPIITVVGLFDGIDTKIMVKGINLDFTYLRNYLLRFKLLVTFNGSCFDIPVLDTHLSGVIPPIPHIDLRFACHRTGLTGGLKYIERKLAIQRPSDVAELAGCDALTLWQRWQLSGNRKWLELLVRYNEEDTINLKKIAQVVYGRLRDQALATC
ncbi:exonuclease [Candidatus Woesearchaeota archaeon CG_4_10_14_0_8_um_filter_47_5]|nr:MAG: exonuclease [Candidatus Woesearchaeota archaeon CG_4_10_14_0_8_um_filter_47_5]